MSSKNRGFFNQQQQSKGEPKVNTQQQPQDVGTDAQSQSSEQTQNPAAQPDTAKEGQTGQDTGTATTDAEGSATTGSGDAPSITSVQTLVGGEPVQKQQVQQQRGHQQQPKQAGKTSPHNSLKIEQQLVSYIENMRPKAALEPVVGGQWQASLFGLLKTVLNNTNQEDFRHEWNTVLNVARQHREAVFHENYILRFPQHWNMSDSEATLFRRLIAVILETAEPKNRGNFGSNVRMDMVVEGLNETQKNNLLNFYA